MQVYSQRTFSADALPTTESRLADEKIGVPQDL